MLTLQFTFEELTRRVDTEPEAHPSIPWYGHPFDNAKRLEQTGIRTDTAVTDLQSIGDTHQIHRGFVDQQQAHDATGNTWHADVFGEQAHLFDEGGGNVGY